MYLDFHSAIILFPPGFISGIIGFNLSLFLEYSQLSFSVAKLSWQPITTNLVSGFSNNVNFHSIPCWIFGSSFRPLCWPPQSPNPRPFKASTIKGYDIVWNWIFPLTDIFHNRACRPSHACHAQLFPMSSDERGVNESPLPASLLMSALRGRCIYFSSVHVKCKAANRPFVSVSKRKFHGAINKEGLRGSQDAFKRPGVETGSPIISPF